MYAIKKVKGAALGVPVGLAIGVIVCLLVTLAGAALTAWLMTSETIGEDGLGYAVMMILVLASCIGALTAVCLTKRMRLQVSMLTGGVYYLALLAITALLFGGQYQGMGVSAIMILIGCALVAFLPVKNGRLRPGRKKAYR